MGHYIYWDQAASSIGKSNPDIGMYAYQGTTEYEYDKLSFHAGTNGTTQNRTCLKFNFAHYVDAIYSPTYSSDPSFGNGYGLVPF